MKKSILALALLALALPLAAQDAPRKDQPHRRVLLVTIDALRPEVYREERFATPNVRALAARGVQARRVVGVFPSLTYPSHTAIVTGCRTARHGIMSNMLFDPRTGGHRWFFEAAHIRATTLWDAAHRGGLTSGAVSWPVTVGAGIDFLIPEVFTDEKVDDPFELCRKASTPGLFDEVWSKPDSTEEPAVDVSIAKAAARILEKKKPNLMLVHLVEADGAQHHAGREDAEVYEAFKKVDEHIGTLLRALETAGVASETNVIITGDHGMIDVHTAVRPNAILREAGLLSVDDKGHVKDWTARAAAMGASAPIYLRDPSDKAAAERVLSALRSAANRAHGLWNLLERDALDREEAFPGALCAVEGEPGYTMENGAAGDVLGAAHVRGNHGYLPSREDVQTGLVMAGPGIARGRTIASFRQIDVAPLVAHLLGVELTGTQGVLIPGVLAQKETVREPH